MIRTAFALTYDPSARVLTGLRGEHTTRATSRDLAIAWLHMRMDPNMRAWSNVHHTRLSGESNPAIDSAPSDADARCADLLASAA